MAKRPNSGEEWNSKITTQYSEESLKLDEETKDIRFCNRFGYGKRNRTTI